MFDREKAIESLIDNAIASILHDDLTTIPNIREEFVKILRFGFEGYDNMSDEELMKECEDRDISYLFGEDDPSPEDQEVERLKDEKNGVYPGKWDIAN